MTDLTMTPERQTDTSTARRAMIDSQLRTSGVNEEYVLARMIAVPREEFYGKLLMEAAPARDDRVLVVEGGTGYLAELLRPLVGELATVSASDAATKAGGSDYSLIVIDGAIAQLPEALEARLADQGRIVCGVVLRQVTRLASGRKVGGNVVLQPVEDLGIPVLHAFDAPKSWTFA